MSATSETSTRRTSGEVLKAARARTSKEKRGRVSQVVQQMLCDGEQITFAEVARSARVSTWLVYAEGPREEIRAAIRSQQRRAEKQRESGTEVSTSSLRADLAIARQEIKQLRRERDQLRDQVRGVLGRKLHDLNAAPLVERINTLTRELQDAHDVNGRLNAENIELQDELAGARIALRRMIKDGARDGQS